MRQRRIKRVKEGDPILADDWNYMADLVEINSIDVGSSPGLSMRQGPGGTALALSVTSLLGSVALTTSGITARVTTTPGQGNVTLYQLDTSGPTLNASTTGVKVYNFSSVVGGIASGTWVWVQQDMNNNWWVTAINCGT